MIAIVQRVRKASVTVNNSIVGQIGSGILGLASVHADDTPFDIQWMAQKLTTLRIFTNGEKYFDLDIKAVNGSILLVSNFTVAADTQSGRRPSLSNAAGPTIALPLFNALIEAVKAQGVPVQTGQFGADMLVDLTNDGPVTFILDSRPSRKPPGS